MRIVADKPRANASRQSSCKRPRDPAVSSVPPVVAHGAAMPRPQPQAGLLALQRIIDGQRLPRPVGEPGPMDHTQIHEAAKRGTSGPSGPLPYLDTIQKLFGKHQVSEIEAHTDEAAAAAAGEIDAVAYTTGNHVVFAGKPSLHTVAHEAAHVVQQRAGVHLKDGVGQQGDRYERHADLVAKQVVQGQSAEPLLDESLGASTALSGLQAQSISEGGAKGETSKRAPGTRYRSLPRLVGQIHTWSCWAAAMESWLAATKSADGWTQHDLIVNYSTDQVRVGAIDAVKDFPVIASHFGIELTVMAGNRVTEDFIAEKLHKHGHLLVVYNLAPGVAHANVIYGIGYPTGTTKLISVMDPSHAGSYENRPLSFYSSRNALAFAWRE